VFEEQPFVASGPPDKVPIGTHNQRELSLVSTEIEAEIDECLCRVRRIQEFKNVQASAMEVLYEFPIEAKEVVSKMMFTFDDRVVEAKVIESSKAKDKYDDAMAAGKGGVIMQKDQTQKFYQLFIGNIPSEGTVKVEIEIFKHLEPTGG